MGSSQVELKGVQRIIFFTRCIILANRNMKSKVKLLISWVGRLLGFDAAYFAKNSFWVSFKNGVGMLVGFCLSIAWARLASKQVYGQYTFVLSIMYLLTFLSVPRFNFALSQAVAKGYEGALKQTTKVSFLGSLVAGLAFLAVASRYFYLGDPGLGYSFIWVAIFFPLLFGLKTYDHFLIGKRRFDRSAQFAALSSVLTGISLILALRLPILVFLYLLINGGGNVVFWNYTRSLVRNKKKDPDVVRFGMYLTGLSLAAMLMSRFGQVLLNQFQGAEMLATYTIAMVIPSAIQNQLQNLIDVAKIKVADRGRQQLVGVWRRHGWKWLGLGLGTAALLWLTLPVVIPLIYSNKYNDAVIYAQVASLALILWPVNTFIGELVVLEKKKKIIALSHFIPSVPSMILLPLMISRWGIWGALVVNLLASIYMVPFNLWAFRRKKDL